MDKQRYRQIIFRNNRGRDNTVPPASVIDRIFTFIGGNTFLSLLTDDAPVLAAAARYLPWAVAIPVAGVAAFVWDGVFIGTTSTRAMLLSSAVAGVLFFAVFFAAAPALHNHGLWLAFICYLAARGIVQTFLFKRVNTF